MSNNPSIAICIYACASKLNYLEEIRNIKRCWYLDAITNGVRVYFFLGGAEGEPIVDECSGPEFVYLPGVKNDYESASHKQNNGIKYIFSNDETPPDYVFCCGTDTYVSIENLIKLTKEFYPTQLLYLGGHGCHRTLDGEVLYYHSGGPGFVLSRAMVEHIENNVVSFENMFDEWKNVCSRNGEKAMNDLLCACDVAISYFIKRGTSETTKPLIVRYDEGFCFMSDIVKIEDVVGCHYWKGEIMK